MKRTLTDERRQIIDHASRGRFTARLQASGSGGRSMQRNIQIGVLSRLALAFAAFLLLDIAYFFNGSLELFPTHEQQGKIKGMALLSGFCFALAEAAVLFLLRRLFRD